MFPRFPLKASYNGVCPWGKCSHVYHPKTDNSGIYNDHGVHSGRAEICTANFWKVIGPFL
jgi:hypothetical protein